VNILQRGYGVVRMYLMTVQVALCTTSDQGKNMSMQNVSKCFAM